MRTEYFVHLFILIFILFLSSCDENSSFSHIAGGGISGTGISVGPISAFGSVFVNGIEFETHQASIIVNKQPMTESALKLGMVVQIEGIIHADGKRGKALRIHFNENAKGLVQQIDEDNNTLKVLGQTVMIDRLTVLDGITELSELKVGDIVSVSGFVDANDSIHATWIMRESRLSEFEIVGPVANLDRATQTFTMGDLTINYSQTLRLDVPAGLLNNGLLVEVKGTLADTKEVVLLANHIATETEFFGAKAGTPIEVEGFITQFNSPVDFEVARLPVTTNTQTVFEFGRIDDLTLGVKVEVEGQLDANGILILEDIAFPNTIEQTSTRYFEIEAEVEALDTAKQTVTLLGLPIQTLPTTQFRDRRDAKIPFGLSNLSLGDRIAISGFSDLATSHLIAEILLREPFRPDGQVILEGVANHIDSQLQTLTILGIQILTDSDTLYQDERLGNTGTTISIEQFFTNLQSSEVLVEVQGIVIGKAILAKRLEIGD